MTPNRYVNSPTNVISLTMANLTDRAGNAGVGTVVTANYAVDMIAPVVTSVTVPSNATYGAGQSLIFTVNWSKDVTADTTNGTPRIALDVGGATVYANYVSGTGSALVFEAVVPSGTTDADGITVASSIALNGGTLSDLAGNAAQLTLNSVEGTSSVLVDAASLTVSSVTVPANGTYRTGQNLDFTVTWSGNVTVTGTPRIPLNVGSSTVYASYLSGSGTSRWFFGTRFRPARLTLTALA